MAEHLRSEAGPHELSAWVIYERPSDYPDDYVLREQFIGPGGAITFSGHAWASKSPDLLRALMPFGLINMGPDPEDPVIIEVWM